jgi:sporulation protein YlmC with PRC-barrel domain
MLHRERRLKGTLVRGTDGSDLGVVERLYFDDQRWTIRHLAVRRDKSLNDGLVLIPPSSIQRNWSIAMLVTNISRNEIRDLPEIGSDADPPATGADLGHVRNTDQMIGFHLKATDGEIGHVDDLLIDEDSWRICSLVVDTSNWIGGKWVAIVPSVLRAIDWADRTIEVAITRDAVKHSPPMEAMPVPSAETMPPFVLM